MAVHYNVVVIIQETDDGKHLTGSGSLATRPTKAERVTNDIVRVSVHSDSLQGALKKAISHLSEELPPDTVNG